MVSSHKPLGEPVSRPEPALALTPTTRGTRVWGVGMTEVCLFQPPQAQKPVLSPTKTQQSSPNTIAVRKKVVRVLIVAIREKCPKVANVA